MLVICPHPKWFTACLIIVLFLIWAIPWHFSNLFFTIYYAKTLLGIGKRKEGGSHLESFYILTFDKLHFRINCSTQKIFQRKCLFCNFYFLRLVIVCGQIFFNDAKIFDCSLQEIVGKKNFQWFDAFFNLWSSSAQTLAQTLAGFGTHQIFTTSFFECHIWKCYQFEPSKGSRVCKA